jgi:ubiquinone/menaquinone biosynthesis C-methylase UbiE
MASSPPAEPAPARSQNRVMRLLVAFVAALLRFAFHLLYNQLAFAYDAVAWIVSFGEWAAWRRCVIPYLRPGPILDIAHGPAGLSFDLAQAGFEVTAIDISPAMSRIAAAKKRGFLRRNHPHREPVFIRADVMHLPFSPGRFPQAVSTFPAEYIFNPRIHREVRRCLQAGGRWIIIPTAYPAWLAPLIARSDPQAPQTMSHFLQLEGSGFHVRTETVRRKRSTVLVVIAEKTSSRVDVAGFGDPGYKK